MAPFHEIHDAIDIGEAATILRRFSPNLRIEGESDRRHSVRLDGDERLALVHAEFSGETRADDDPEDEITILATLQGRLDWRADGEQGASAPWIRTPRSSATMRFGALTAVATILPVGPLLEFARTAYGDDAFRLRFDGSRPVSAALGPHVATVLEQAQILAGSGAFESPIVRIALHRRLAAVLLECFRVAGNPRRRILRADARRRRYRAAARFIDDYASLPVTTEDAARAVDLTSDELDDIFRGFSPSGSDVSGHLQHTRLGAAREELTQGRRADSSIRDVALRWGFPSASRFTELYRREYGVGPSTLLR